MSQAADLIRNKRRLFAMPGGKHDHMVRTLARALPGAVGVIVAVMVIAPLFPRGEVSFLLDRNKVAITQERIRLEKATYRGQDKSGRPFSLTAGNAVQRSPRVSVVEMQDLNAEMMMSDGPAQLKAPAGAFHYDTNKVNVSGPLDFTAAGGYRLTTSAVEIDLKQQHVTGAGGVSGAVPSGTFTAERIDADLDERTVTLSGRARMRMQPGQIRMPAH